MLQYWWRAIVFRIFLPSVIAIAVFIRPTISSYVYMIMGCYAPFFSVATSATVFSGTEMYIKTLMIVCSVLCLLVFSFDLGIYFLHRNNYILKPCSFLEKTLRTLGVIDYTGLPIEDTITWCFPDLAMLIISILLYRFFIKSNNNTPTYKTVADLERETIHRNKLINMMLHFGIFLVCLLFCVTAILKATAFGLVYYIVFLGILTYWACYQTLGRVFARLLVCLTPIIFLNISIIFIYQLQYFQDSAFFEPETIWGRLFNLVDLKTYKDCKDPRLFAFYSNTNLAYAITFCLFILYSVSVLVARELLEAKDGILNLLGVVFYYERSAAARWRVILKAIKQKIDDKKCSNLMADKLGFVLNLAFHFVLGQAYIIGNIIMMVWAIIYIGWTSLIFLIWANLMWLLPSRKKTMLVTSPFLVIVVQIVLLGNYLYSFNLTEAELPRRIGLLDATSGFAVRASRVYKNNWTELLSKSIFGILIVLSMRQFWQERAELKQEIELAKILGRESSRYRKSHFNIELDTMARIQNACINFFGIWWIWVVILTMVWMIFWSNSNLFKIAFMGLAMLFLTTFQLCPFNYWKKFLWVYWWIVIVYALINLLVVYMYQIKETRKLLHAYVSRSDFEKLGFTVWTNTTEGFKELAKPLFFQIAIVTQYNYFQEPFNLLTSPTDPRELIDEEDRVIAAKDSTWNRLTMKFRSAVHVFFCVLEAHLLNAILLVGWLMCLFDLCAIFAAFVLLFTAGCILSQRFAKILIYLISVLVQILIVARLLYMNQYSQHAKWNYVGNYTRNGKPYNVTLNTADWLGFHESSYGRKYADFWQLSWCFIYVFMVTLSRIVDIRMSNYRFSRNLPTPKDIVLFPDITYRNCHTSTTDILKYLANYGFYKFGCEITLIYASIVMALRMDAIAIPISIWILLMFSLNRKWMKRLWLPGVVILTIAIPFQYAFTLGWWPSFFNKSQTKFWNSTDFRLRLQQFCHFMNMAHPPIKRKITLDFMLLLIMSRQQHAFNKKLDSVAGNNDSVLHLIDVPHVDNHVPDYISYTKNHIDAYKKIFFFVWFYVGLIALFLAGSMRPTLYSVGYIMGALVFLWEGSDLFLRPANSIMYRWNLLIGYNVLVMIATTVSQIFGCILKYESAINLNCGLYRLFTVGCVDKFGMTKGIPNVSQISPCEVDAFSLGLSWDCFCFFSLICQQRIFKSFHFFHVVNGVKAHTILGNRGAELIEEKRRQQKRNVDNERIAIANNIRKKIERIHANYAKIEAIRAGEYAMFDEVEKSIDIPLLPPKEEEESDYDSYDPMPITEYLGLFNVTDIKTVVDITTMRRRRKTTLMNKGMKKADVKPQPSTSSDSNKIHTLTKVTNFLRFVWGIFESIIVSIIGVIDKITKPFRSILDKIDKDSRILNEKTNFSQGTRLGSNKIWQPVDSYTDILNRGRQEIKRAAPLQYSIYFKLPRAVWYLIMAYSEWLCYLVIVLNQALQSNFISLPLTIMMFCWGALTVPKPTRSFWIVTIAYVIIMVTIKTLFGMGAAPWGSDSYRYNIFFPPAIIGLRNENYVMNVVLLIVLFFHRIVLQLLGLWKPHLYRVASLVKDGDYILKDGQFIAVAPGDLNKGQQAFDVWSSPLSVGDYFPNSVIHGLKRYADGFRLYMQQLIAPSAAQIPVDVYTPMFLCDAVNLFLIVFFFGRFQTENVNEGILDYIASNRVSMSFIITVLAYVVLMMIDRCLYLRKHRFGKLIYHFFQVVGFHVWLFILYPLTSNREFSRVPVLQLFYVAKCLYFLFSACQIRNGYPVLISFHCLWHGYTSLHKQAYSLYRAIPYFLEVRCLLDWICSDSCLGIPGWFKLEDITQNLFNAKCDQQFARKWHSPGGQRQSRTMKYFYGGFAYILLVFAMIFPFLLFSLSSTVGIATQPINIFIELYIGDAEPIFQSYSAERDRIQLTLSEYENLTNTFNYIKNSMALFDVFQPEDIVVVRWSSHSLTSWDISPPNKKILLRQLEGDNSFSFRLEIHYTHIGHGGEASKSVFGQNTNIPPLPNEQRQALIDIIKSPTGLNKMVTLPLIYPKFLLIGEDSKPVPLSIMEHLSTDVNYEVEKSDGVVDDDDDDDDLPQDSTRFRNLLVTLQSTSESWWQVTEECKIEDDNYFYQLKDLVHNSCDELKIYIFNEKVFSGTMQYITQGGIIGLYLIYFMVVLEIFSGFHAKAGSIWLGMLPNPNKILRKCMELYVARDMNNYELEGEIFEELICIMRSREMLIKLTRFEDDNYDATVNIPGSKKSN